MRRPRHFHVWRTRRAVWAVVVGAVTVVGTCVAGVVGLALEWGVQSDARHCGELAIDIQVRRQAFGTASTCSIGLATGQRFTGFGPAPTRHPTIDADQLHRLRSGIPASVIRNVSQRIHDVALVVCIGAPLRCLHGTVAAPSNTGPRPTYVGLHCASAGGRTWVIPYRPLPGLAYSWAFWAAVAYIGLTGVSFVRVHGRLRKGKCPACAYVMVGLARCPECGTVVNSDGLEARPTGEDEGRS